MCSMLHLAHPVQLWIRCQDKVVWVGRRISTLVEFTCASCVVSAAQNLRWRSFKLSLMFSGWAPTNRDTDSTSAGGFSSLAHSAVPLLCAAAHFWKRICVGWLDFFQRAGYNGVWPGQKGTDTSGSCIPITRRGQRSSAAAQAETHQLHTAGEPEK